MVVVLQFVFVTSVESITLLVQWHVHILISLPGTLCKFEAEILVLMFIDIARSRLKLGYLQTLQSSNQYESKESGVLK